MTGLGKLAAGADVASLGLSGPGLAAMGDVEMVDVGAEQEVVPASGSGSAVPAQGKGQGQGQGQGGKGKKKGGKGKR